MEPVTIGVGVGWGISILGWLISPSMTKLVNKGWSYLGDVAGSSADKLQDLESKVQRLKLVFEAAQGSPEAEEKSQRWLKKLRSAFYDAEDIIDEIDYHRLADGNALIRRQSANTTKQKATAKKDFSFPPGSRDNLRKTLKSIEKLIDEGEKLLPLLRLTTSGGNMKSSPEQATGSISLSETTSEPEKVFGRDKDTENIISMLHDTAADHSVVGIYGISGSGKTTLAQYVCEWEKNSGAYFELIMWIHVTQNFNVHTVYNEMLEIVSGKKMDSLSNLDKLQSDLKKSLKGKKFLLVLDDVWCSESVYKQDDLKKLLSPLKESDKGSRVLVTSRTADAAKLLGAQNPMPISDMDEDEFFKMFMHYALHDSPVRDQDKGKFERIGREISLRLRKSPLAAKMVAGQLRLRTSRSEDIEFWIDTWNRKSDLLNDTMGALWWSYHQLDEHVRQCFAYCSMFPRRYELKRDELVKMWVAQGFVDTSKNSDAEAAARQYFEVLKSASFVQLHSNIFPGYYKVHDLLHDLAERVAGSDCFRIDNDMVDYQIPQDVRHIFIHSDNLEELIEKIVKLDTLRTIVMSRTKISAEKFKLILKDLKKLRFVQVWLGEFGRNVIPECIGKLKHLRYLGISGHASDRGIIDLPPAFTKLYHLHELFIPGVLQVQCPGSNDMADLENLRHIRGTSLRVSIPNIGRMPRLQTLGSCYTVKKEKGYEITQLEKLDNIRGVLSISGLENIKSKEDARRANLSNKTRVFRLHFDWKSYEDQGTESGEILEAAAGHHQQVGTPEPGEILEALHPPALLNELIIGNYGGSTFPSWLSGDGKLELLELSFYGCHGSGSQLRFSEPLPNIHSLCIIRCSWDSLPDNIEQLASLENLYIHDCPNIQSPPGLPSSLKQLTIDDCPNISTLPELPLSLEGLMLECWSDIQSLPGLPSSLKQLSILYSDIQPPPGLPSSLKELYIEGCPNISTLPELPPSLKKLLIADCPDISILPALPPTLKKLFIKGCPNISTLPELPPSLKELDCEQCLVDSYPDRQAIDRIKNDTW